MLALKSYNIIWRLVFCLFLSHCAHMNAADDSAALAAFYNATNNQDWRLRCRWSYPPNCLSRGILCDTSNRVTNINLADCNISGTLPHQWSTLSGLVDLALHSNRFTGTVPHQWSNMSALQFVTLQHNQLVGTLPHQWSKLPVMGHMVFDNNHITGTLPHQWSRLTALMFLSVESNQLEGTLPREWSSLSMLQYIIVDHNRLSSTLPRQWSGMAALEYMYLRNNSLCGTIPSEWRVLLAVTSGILVLQANPLRLEHGAWYTVLPYSSTVDVSQAKPAVACEAASRSLSVWTSGSDTVTRTESAHCDVQRCGVVESVSTPPHATALRPTPAASPLLQCAPVAYRTARDTNAFALRLACEHYPLPLLVRNAVLLHTMESLAIETVGLGEKGEVLLILQNETTAAGSVERSWLPPGAVPLRSGNAIRIGLTISCNREVAIEVIIPVQPEPLPRLVEAAASTAGAAQWMSAFGGAGAAVSVGRVAAAQRLLLCGDANAANGGLLGISVGEGDATSFARGAVVGNAAVLAGASAVLVCTALIYGAVTGVALPSSLLRVALPSSLLPVWTALIPTTASALPELMLAHESGYVLLGFVLVLLPKAFLLVLPFVAGSHWGLKVEHDAGTEEVHGRIEGCSALAELLRRSIARQWRWRRGDAPDTTDATAAALRALTGSRAAWVVLLDYRVLWYPALDSAVLAATCALGAVSGIGGARNCRGAGWASLALCGGQLGVCFVVQPFTTLSSNVHSVVCLALTTVALLLQGVGLASEVPLPASFITTAVTLQLIVLGLSFVKLSEELWRVLRSGQRLMIEMVSGNHVRRSASLEECADGTPTAAACALPLEPVAPEASELELLYDCSALPYLGDEGDAAAPAANTGVNLGDVCMCTESEAAPVVVALETDQSKTDALVVVPLAGRLLLFEELAQLSGMCIEKET